MRKMFERRGFTGEAAKALDARGDRFAEDVRKK